MAQGSEAFRATPARLLAILQSVLPQIGMKVHQVASDGVVAKTGIGLRSLGEEIMIILKPQGPLTRVDVTSEPKAQLFDWGKGDENVAAVLEAVRRSL